MNTATSAPRYAAPGHLRLLERFFAILLEHHAGRLPAWLAPVQAAVLTITDRQDEYALKVAETLKNQGVRAVTDLRNEKVGFKIREHTLPACFLFYWLRAIRRSPLICCLWRTRSGKDLGTMSSGDVLGTPSHRA